MDHPFLSVSYHGHNNQQVCALQADASSSNDSFSQHEPAELSHANPQDTMVTDYPQSDQQMSDDEDHEQLKSQQGLQLQLNQRQLEQLYQLLELNNIPTQYPVLRCEVIPANEPQLIIATSQQPRQLFLLAKDDIQNVFQVFGEIVDVHISADEGCAFITFQNIVGAFSAQSNLNDQYLEGIKATLKVNWEPVKQKELIAEKSVSKEISNQDSQSSYQESQMTQKQTTLPTTSQQTQNSQFLPSFNSMETQNPVSTEANSGGSVQHIQNSVNQAQSQQYEVPQIPQRTYADAPAFTPTNTSFQSNSGENLFQQLQQYQMDSYDEYGMSIQSQAADKVAKYTCRFDIQIKNEKEFQVCRRLIGTKGCNMKRIIEQCSAGNKEVVKLRLRGKGSGFKEGPNQVESDEQLHMCVSSGIYEKYSAACDAVEELIKKVYAEYKHWTGRKYGQRNAKQHTVKRQELLCSAPKPTAAPFIPSNSTAVSTNQKVISDDVSTVSQQPNLDNTAPVFYNQSSNFEPQIYSSSTNTFSTNQNQNTLASQYSMNIQK